MPIRTIESPGVCESGLKRSIHALCSLFSFSYSSASYRVVYNGPDSALNESERTGFVAAIHFANVGYAESASLPVCAMLAFYLL